MTLPLASGDIGASLVEDSRGVDDVTTEIKLEIETVTISEVSEQDPKDETVIQKSVDNEQTDATSYELMLDVLQKENADLSALNAELENRLQEVQKALIHGEEKRGTTAEAMKNRLVTVELELARTEADRASCEARAVKASRQCAMQADEIGHAGLLSVGVERVSLSAVPRSSAW